MREAVIQKILKKKVIVNISGVYGETCLKLASALNKGGIELISITFDSKDNKACICAQETLQLLVRQLGHTVTFGASNLMNWKMVDMAKCAGAEFAISPDANDAMILAVLEAGMVSIPGALTPTEVIYAHNCGADFVNVFPASSMGPAYFTNTHNVLKHIPLLAFGGINRNNVRLYMHGGSTGVCVDDCLYSAEQVANGDWDQITNEAIKFMQTI